MREKYTSITKKQFIGTMTVMTMVELANAVSCVVDGLITSRFLGSTEMAAYGIAAPYFSIVAIVSGILMVSCQTMCARSVGSGRMEEAKGIFSLTCVLGLLFSGILTILGILFAGPFSTLLGARGASAGLLPYTKSYLIGLFLGTPANVLVVILAPIVQLDGDSRRANLASAVVAVTDILANLFFVAVLDLGLVGIGLGTTVSYIAALAVLLTHFVKKDRMFRFSLKKDDWKRTLPIITGGLPRGISMFCRALGPVFTNAVVLSIAATAGMTAMSIQNNIKFFVGAPACGIGGAVLLIAGIFAGEQDMNELRHLLQIAARYAVLGIGALAALVFAAAPLAAQLYLPDDAVVRVMAVDAIRWYALSLPLAALNMIIGSYLQAIGNQKGAYLFNIGSELVCVITCVVSLSHLFGLDGVWAAFPAGQLLLLVIFLCCAFFRKNTKAKGIDKMLFLPDDFCIPEEDGISISVHSMEEVIGLSERVGDFCKKHGVDDRRTCLLSLCIEEMAGNTVQYGFSDGKRHSIDIRVIIKEDEILLRLRDDCRRFDLKEKVESWELDREHPEENVGIRMVLGLSKDVSYANTMSMNNLMITI